MNIYSIEVSWNSYPEISKTTYRIKAENLGEAFHKAIDIFYKTNTISKLDGLKLLDYGDILDI